MVGEPNFVGIFGREVMVIWFGDVSTVTQPAVESRDLNICMSSVMKGENMFPWRTLREMSNEFDISWLPFGLRNLTQPVAALNIVCMSHLSFTDMQAEHRALSR